MVRIAVLDANVLWPQYLRDALLTAAEYDLYRGHWTDAILNEARKSLIREGRLTPERAQWTFGEMRRGFPQFMVTGYEPLIPLMTNDEKDRHILAAAAHIGADTVVTFNTKDFPSASRKEYRIDLAVPDEFLTDLWLSNTPAMAHALVQMAKRLKAPPLNVQQLVGEALRRQAPAFAELVLASGALETAVRTE